MSSSRGIVAIVEEFNSITRKLILSIHEGATREQREGGVDRCKDLIFTVMGTDPTLIIDKAGPKLYENASIIYSPSISSLDVLATETKYKEEIGKSDRVSNMLRMVKDIFPQLPREEKDKAIAHLRSLLDIYMEYLELHVD